VLWFEYQMSSTGSCVEGLGSRWWHYFGKFWKLQKVGASWRKEVTGGMSLKVIPGLQFLPCSLLPGCHKLRTSSPTHSH
jgi:hypothetical protein